MYHYTNKTTTYFSKIIEICSLGGLPNVWKVNRYNTKGFEFFHRLIALSIFIFISTEIVSFFTLTNLTEKQSKDRIIFSFSHPILISYYVCIEYNKKKFKLLLIKLLITVKKVFNDPVVEKRMIKMATTYSTAFMFTVCTALISYGFDGLVEVIHAGLRKRLMIQISVSNGIGHVISAVGRFTDLVTDGTFTTVITAWPSPLDKSVLANFVRVINFMVWWAFVIRVSATYVVIITVATALSHQYKNLQSYFYNLNDLFENAVDDRAHNENEITYMKALQVGIKLHSDTLWCKTQFQEICSPVFSGSIMINIFVLCMLMLQMVNSERTLLNGISTLTTSAAVLLSTGCVMWNAGDVTVEAAVLPSAMYSSGWENCRDTVSRRVRNLLVVAMQQGQKEVIIRGFGIFEISYQSHLAIVKSSYSTFSLLY